MAPPKGFIPWNKGLKGIHLSPATEFKKGIRYSPKTEFKKGHKPKNPIKKGERRGIETEFTREKTLKENNFKLKGEKVGYYGSHSWIQRNYGRARKCENKENELFKFLCSEKSKRFDWAFINKKGYERDKKLYIQLCHSCHLKYDRS